MEHRPEPPSGDGRPSEDRRAFFRRLGKWSLVVAGGVAVVEGSRRALEAQTDGESYCDIAPQEQWNDGAWVNEGGTDAWNDAGWVNEAWDNGGWTDAGWNDAAWTNNPWDNHSDAWGAWHDSYWDIWNAWNDSWMNSW